MHKGLHLKRHEIRGRYIIAVLSVHDHSHPVFHSVSFILQQGVSTSKYAEIQYAVNKLQGGNTNDPNNDQLGDNVRTFVKELKGVGMSETQIANFTNLDDFIVEKDEL